MKHLLTFATASVLLIGQSAAVAQVPLPVPLILAQPGPPEPPPIMFKLPLDPSSRISSYLKKQWLIMADIRSNHRTIYDFIIVRLDLDHDRVESHIIRIGDVLAGVIAEGIDRGEFPNQDPRRASAVFIIATAALWHPKLLSSSSVSCSHPEDLVQFALSALTSTEIQVFTV